MYIEYHVYYLFSTLSFYFQQALCTAYTWTLKLSVMLNYYFRQKSQNYLQLLSSR